MTSTNALPEFSGTFTPAVYRDGGIDLLDQTLLPQQELVVRLTTVVAWWVLASLAAPAVQATVVVEFPGAVPITTLEDAAAVTGQNYSGNFGFADTTALLTVNHEIAPASEALGAGITPDACLDCHQSGTVDFTALGWTADPMDGGVRNTTAVVTESSSSLLSVKSAPALD